MKPLLIFVTILFSTASAETHGVDGVEFFGYDSDGAGGSNELESDDPCFYDSRRDVSPRRLEKCLDNVKRQASDTSSYWFGERWKTNCANSRTSGANAIACYNPPKLQRYESLGARLLRVPTFDMAYLRNLAIFPQMIFVSSPGQYSACDHVYRSDQRQDLAAMPSMSPAPPWHLRHPPIIRWTSRDRVQKHQRDEDSRGDSSYIQLIVDVGFGDLYYLAYNYPHKTVTVKDYSGPLNFRDYNNPVALLVFRQSTSHLKSIDWRSALEDDSSFNVQKFMIKNNLTQSWIGLNWVNVGTDGYAIEEQRRTSFVDNCPLLIRNRLFSPLDGVRLKFLPSAALTTVDTWITITFAARSTNFVLCCKKYSFETAEIQLDPLGDKELRPVYMRHAPNISVLRPPPVESEMYAYRRFSRDYMTVPDDGQYTLLIVDSTESSDSHGGPLALWLVINIRGTNLREFTENKAGMTTLPYMAPTPTHDRLHRYVVLLFRQQNPITSFDLKHYSGKNCKTKYIGRCQFNVQELMARNGLTLRALNWVLARQDEYVKYEMVRKGEQDQRKMCSHNGAHYEENCHPVAETVIGHDGRVYRSGAVNIRVSLLTFSILRICSLILS